MEKGIFLLGVFLFGVLVFFCVCKKKSEHYDTVVSPKIPLEECVKKCKENGNCGGVGYDPILKRCYMSKSIIGRDPRLDPTIKYGLNYRLDHIICNKIFPYVEGDNFETLRNNSLFVCSKLDGNNKIDKKYGEGATSYYIQRFGRLDLLGEGVNFDTIFEIDKYNISQVPL